MHKISDKFENGSDRISIGTYVPFIVKIARNTLQVKFSAQSISNFLGWQATEGSPGRTCLAWGGSFLLLPRRHALSSRWLWTFNHNACENRLGEVQGSATSSLFKPPLFQNTWLCVQLLCAERKSPCQRDLAIDKVKPPVVQSRQPLTYRLMESVGLGGPRWHESSWQRGIAESGSSRLSW